MTYSLVDCYSIIQMPTQVTLCLFSPAYFLFLKETIIQISISSDSKFVVSAGEDFQVKMFPLNNIEDPPMFRMLFHYLCCLTDIS